MVDLFAGSGSLGIEALSRGAEHAIFIENNRDAVDHLWANLEFLGFQKRATVVRSDVTRWLAAGVPPSTTLVFADPPYAFSAWADLLEAFVASLTANDGLAVVETRELLPPDRYEPHWQLAREHRYGGTVVSMLTPRAAVSQTIE